MSDEMEVPENGECYFCGTGLTSDWFCYGCEYFICEYCDETEAYGNHEPEDHKEE